MIHLRYIQYNKNSLHNAIFIMFPEGRAYSRRFVCPFVRHSAFSCPEYNFKTTTGMNMDLCVLIHVDRIH